MLGTFILGSLFFTLTTALYSFHLLRVTVINILARVLYNTLPVHVYACNEH